MMYCNRITLVVLIFAVLCQLIACSDPGTQLSSVSGSGQLIIRAGVAEQSRTILPANVAIATYAISGTGPGRTALPSMADSSGGTFTANDLVPGDWSISVSGKDASGVAIASGSANVTVISGSTVSVSIQMVPQGGQGNLALAVTWPAYKLVDSVYGSLISAGGAATPVNLTVSGHSAALASQSLAAGSYILTLNFRKAGATVAAARQEAALIYAGQTSSGSFTLLASDFQTTDFTETAPTVYKYCADDMSITAANGSVSTQTHRYHFRAPAAYNGDKSVSYPLIISLHGWGFPNSESCVSIPPNTFGHLQDGSPASTIPGSGSLPAFEYSPICPPPYYTSNEPSAPNGGEWNSPAAKQMIVGTIKNLMQRFNVDPARIYLVGFSMGGAGTWYIAQAWYEATGYPMAAISRNSGYTPTNQMLDAGQFADVFRSSVWIHVGDQDDMAQSGSLGNFELAKYTYAKLKAQRGAGVETITNRSEGNGLTTKTPSADSMTATLSDYEVGGKSVLRLSVYHNPDPNKAGHSDFSGRDTDFLTWLFDQHL
jgi:predicted esterase